jgi:hypothetical protein
MSQPSSVHNHTFIFSKMCSSIIFTSPSRSPKWFVLEFYRLCISHLHKLCYRPGQLVPSLESQEQWNVKNTNMNFNFIDFCAVLTLHVMFLTRGVTLCSQESVTGPYLGQMTSINNFEPRTLISIFILSFHLRLDIRNCLSIKAFQPESSTQLSFQKYPSKPEALCNVSELVSSCTIQGWVQELTNATAVMFWPPLPCRLGGAVVSVLATGLKTRGFKPGQDDRFLR